MGVAVNVMGFSMNCTGSYEPLQYEAAAEVACAVQQRRQTTPSRQRWRVPKVWSTLAAACPAGEASTH
jgi:hypothetical protein